MTPAAMVLLGLSSIITILVYVWPYQAAVPGLRYRPGFVIRQTSFAISNAIPAGGAFGLAVQLAMLRSYGVTLAVATAGIAVTSLWSVLMTLTLPVMGVLAALTTGALESQWVWVALAGLAATVVSILLLWLILRSEPSARKVGSGCSGRQHRSTGDGLSHGTRPTRSSACATAPRMCCSAGGAG